MKKKTAILISFILPVIGVCFLWIGSPQAQDYPASPVQIVIPYSPGGLTDIFCRSISDSLASNIKGTLAIVNKPGGGGVVGTSSVVNSKPDGYTLVNISPEAVSIAPAFTPNMPYDPEKDISYIGKTCVVGFGFAVRNESPFKTLEDLVAFAKANPKKLKTAGMGIVGTPHMILGCSTGMQKSILHTSPSTGVERSQQTFWEAMSILPWHPCPRSNHMFFQAKFVS